MIFVEIRRLVEAWIIRFVIVFCATEIFMILFYEKLIFFLKIWLIKPIQFLSSLDLISFTDWTIGIETIFGSR